MDVGDLQRLHEVVTGALEATTIDGVATVLVDDGTAALDVSVAGARQWAQALALRERPDA